MTSLHYEITFKDQNLHYILRNGNKHRAKSKRKKKKKSLLSASMSSPQFMIKKN